MKLFIIIGDTFNSYLTPLSGPTYPNMFFDIPMNNNHLDLYNGGWFRLPNKYSSYYYFDVYLEDDVVKIDFDNVINNKDFIDIISEYDSPTYYYGNQQRLFPISNSKFNGLNIKWSTPSMVNPINVSFYSSRNKNIIVLS